MNVGANYSNKTCEFIVWAPFHDRVSLVLTQENEILPMEKHKEGYYKILVKDIRPGTEYEYQIGKQDLKPDPVSNLQPKGVFGPSAIVNHNAFRWKDTDWKGIPFGDLVFYELHVGTFTMEGTFKAIENRVRNLVEIGINALELMPISQFSGSRNWGYDTVFPYAVHNTYGTPDSLRHLVEYCHLNGVAVFLDVIYNHLGPEGNCLGDFAPYFKEDRCTPWGSSINFDDHQCREVRNYFFENALHWLRNYHIDGLRLDAVHAIIDVSSKHFLKELEETVRRYSINSKRKAYLIAETNQNDPIIVRSWKLGGYGLNAQWLDDFHHIIHVLLTGEKSSYYEDFDGLSDLVKSLREGYIYTGQYSRFRHRKHGYSSKGILPNKFIVFSQNHDQIGNRPLGERLITLAGLESAKLATALVVLSPYIPLFFMGEEYGEDAPFLFFTSFSDQTLAENVRKGRKEEHGTKSSEIEIPDPQSSETFEHSRINWQHSQTNRGKKILEYYRTLVSLRKTLVSSLEKPFLSKVSESEQEQLLILRFGKENSAVAVANFDSQLCSLEIDFDGEFLNVLDSADTLWAGPGSLLSKKTLNKSKLTLHPWSIAVYVKPQLVK